MVYNYVFLMLIYMKLCCHGFLVMPNAIPYHFCACLHSVSICLIALKCATCRLQHVVVSCIAYIFLTVTPFGVFFTCNLTRISCTLCWCYCLLLLTNLKYGLGQNSTKCNNYRGVRNSCHV